MKILCNKNVVDYENIFGIDNNNNIIQTFTFISKYDGVNKKLQNIINNANNVNIDNGYLFYSYSYQKSFCHLLTQTVPKLTKYITQYSNIKLLIPTYHFNELCKDILNICDIDFNNIILLEDNHIYNINNFVFSEKFNAPPDNYTIEHLWIYNKIRMKLNILPNINPYKKIYIKRDNISNPNYNNSESGLLRKITNEEQLINKLLEFNFTILTLGNKSIYEKKEALENAFIIITQLGANCMNLIFTNAPKNLLIISNCHPIGEKYYSELCSKLNNEPINYKLITYQRDNKCNDITNNTNYSFSVNINEIEDYIKNLIS